VKTHGIFFKLNHYKIKSIWFLHLIYFLHEQS